MYVPRAVVGIGVGAAVGLALVVFPTLGLLAAAMGLLVSLNSPGGRVVLGGMLSGVGTCWILLLAFHSVASPCVDTATSGCSAPDLRPFLVAALLMLLAGSLLLFRGTRGETCG